MLPLAVIPVKVDAPHMYLSAAIPQTFCQILYAFWPMSDVTMLEIFSYFGRLWQGFGCG
jgi:hypothetical protein